MPPGTQKATGQGEEGLPGGEGGEHTVNNGEGPVSINGNPPCSKRFLAALLRNGHSHSTAFALQKCPWLAHPLCSSLCRDGSVPVVALLLNLQAGRGARQRLLLDFYF